MHKILCVSEGRLCMVDGQSVTTFKCEAIENYKKNLREIRSRHDWKTKGSGAKFMGMNAAEINPDEDECGAEVVCGASPDDNTVIYAASIENGTAVQLKHFSEDDAGEWESVVCRKIDCVVEDIHCKKGAVKIAASYQQDTFTRDIALINLESGHIDVLTEGDSIDRNPFYLDDNHIYFDSRGIRINANGLPGAAGSARIMYLDLDAQTIDDIKADDRYDYIKPALAPDGSLYCIRRPYKYGKESSGISFFDIILFPVRIIRALLGWLNLVSTLYGGESLRTNGGNPAKSKQKSQKELFIEENLINAQKNLKENSKDGDEFAGILPRDWVLVRIAPGQPDEIIRRAVLDFQFAPDGTLYYSNGSAILRADGTGKPVLAAKLNLANQINII